MSIGDFRNDFLISSHLANVNINETLVLQMVLRDLKYHTNHHRYGYKEEPAYLKYTAQCPYKSGNAMKIAGWLRTNRNRRKAGPEKVFAILLFSVQ